MWRTVNMSDSEIVLSFVNSVWIHKETFSVCHSLLIVCETRCVCWCVMRCVVHVLVGSIVFCTACVCGGVCVCVCACMRACVCEPCASPALVLVWGPLLSGWSDRGPPPSPRRAAFRPGRPSTAPPSCASSHRCAATCPQTRSEAVAPPRGGGEKSNIHFSIITKPLFIQKHIRSQPTTNHTVTHTSSQPAECNMHHLRTLCSSK